MFSRFICYVTWATPCSRHHRGRPARNGIWWEGIYKNIIERNNYERYANPICTALMSSYRCSLRNAHTARKLQSCLSFLLASCTAASLTVLRDDPSNMHVYTAKESGWEKKWSLITAAAWRNNGGWNDQRMRTPWITAVALALSQLCQSRRKFTAKLFLFFSIAGANTTSIFRNLSVLMRHGFC